MAQELLEIKNLTTGKIIYSKGKNTAGDGSTSELPLVAADKLTCKVTQLADPVNFESQTPVPFLPSDNIQVKWGTDLVQRAAGGTLTNETGTNNYSITGLIDYNKIAVSVMGVLEIGKNSKVSVKYSNDNAKGNKIIDLSSGGETKIDLIELLNWTKAKSDSTTEMPDKLKGKTFTLYVNQFHYNITQHSFYIDIRSGSETGDSKFEIAEGFVLSGLGFILRNEPEETKALPA